jgi:hypothetical protein
VPSLAIAAASLAAPLYAAPVATPTAVIDPGTKLLARFAQASFDKEFAARNNAFYVACPYALGTYSFIELSGIRRVYRVLKPISEEEPGVVVARHELLYEPKKVRYYWDLGHKWIDGSQPPTLTYVGDYQHGMKGPNWRFEDKQHICARGEPQEKPALAAIPK